MKAHKVILLAGGNESNTYELLIKGLQMIDKEVGNIQITSSLYRTAAWGPIPQPDFMNVAIMLHSILPPQILLKKILGIESRLGRKRTVKYGPRTIDIDMLFYGTEVIKSKKLTVPHPEIANRKFVLMPCCEIIPHFIHPILNLSIKQLLVICKDELEVTLWNQN